MRSTCPVPRAYLFLAELVDPPPAKPPEMVLRVCRVVLASFTSSTALPFFLDLESETESLLGDGSRLLVCPGLPSHRLTACLFAPTFQSLFAAVCKILWYVPSDDDT